MITPCLRNSFVDQLIKFRCDLAAAYFGSNSTTKAGPGVAKDPVVKYPILSDIARCHYGGALGDINNVEIRTSVTCESPFSMFSPIQETLLANMSMIPEVK